MQSLRHAELKAARALEHLEAAKLELESYYQAGAYSIHKDEKPEVDRSFISIAVKPPSDRLHLIIGDFAHNLRSALDHVIYSLAVVSGKRLPSNRTQWPVLIAPNPQALVSQTKGIDPEAAQIIEGLQPYHEGPDDSYKKNALWQLHMLDIIDKHRRISFHQILADLDITGLTTESEPLLARSPFGGAELSIKKGSPPPQIKLPKNPTISFGSDQEGLALTLDDLAAMHQFVTKDVLPRFSCFFPKSE